MKVFAALGMAVLALLVHADPGQAETRRVVKPGGLALNVVAKASNGYFATVEAFGKQRVTLRLSRGFSSATYTTTGRVSGARIEADFGDLGRISLRFRSAGTERPARGQEDCRGPLPVYRFGRFVGRLEFRGENGYARVATSKAIGSVRRSWRRVCIVPVPKPFNPDADIKRELRGMTVNFLTAEARSSDRRLQFGATNVEGGRGLVKLFAELLFRSATVTSAERTGSIKIRRQASVIFGPPTVLLATPRGREPVRATVAPPMPFRGTAEFVRRGQPPSWEGNLRAFLPGGGQVRLTGPGIRAKFCRVALLTAADGPCGDPPFGTTDAAAVDLLESRYESGSHSQALADVRLSWSM